MNKGIEITVDALAFALEEAKEKERRATEARIQCEQDIINIIQPPLEGSHTEKTEYYSITTTGRLTRNLDADKLPEISGQIPRAIFDRVIRYKPNLNLTELRYIENNEPDIYKIIAEAITSSPAKTSVTVKRLES